MRLVIWVWGVECGLWGMGFRVKRPGCRVQAHLGRSILREVCAVHLRDDVDLDQRPEQPQERAIHCLVPPVPARQHTSVTLRLYKNVRWFRVRL